MSLFINAVVLLVHPITQVLLLTSLCAYTWSRASTPASRQRADWFTLAAVFSFFTNILFRAAAGEMTVWRPYKLDAYAFTLDGYLGHPAFIVGRLVHASPSLRLIVSAAYDLLPIAMLIAFWATVTYRPAETRSATISLAASAFLLPICYALVPVCGPAYAFPSFPALPVGPVTLVSIPLSAAPNAFPSGHFAGALIVCYLLRHWWSGRAAGLAFLSLTFLATLGLGEHYLVDLIASLPYTYCVIRLGLVNLAQSRDAGRQISGFGEALVSRGN